MYCIILHYSRAALGEFRQLFQNETQSQYGGCCVVYQTTNCNKKLPGCIPIDVILGEGVTLRSHTNMHYSSRSSHPPATNRKLAQKLRRFYANVILCIPSVGFYKEETFQQVSYIKSGRDQRARRVFFLGNVNTVGERSTEKKLGSD